MKSSGRRDCRRNPNPNNDRSDIKQYMAKKIQKSNSGMDIPDYQFEALARCLLPKIQKYYESEEGKKDLEDYRAEKAKQAQAEKENK